MGLQMISTAKIQLLSQRLHRTRLLALVAQNTFRGVFPLSRIVVYLHVHWADFQTLTTLNAFLLVAMDAQP